MGGQDCNTQSASGVYTNTVVVQRHSVVMTKTDKIYKVRNAPSPNLVFFVLPLLFLPPLFFLLLLPPPPSPPPALPPSPPPPTPLPPPPPQVRCTYDTSSKNITFGMMPIR